MFQNLIVILIVGAAVFWLGVYVYRFWKPKKTSGCAGGCCSAAKETPAAPAGPRTMFLPAEDLVRRIESNKRAG